MNRYQKHRANRTLARIKKHDPQKYLGIAKAAADAKLAAAAVVPARKKA